MQAEELSLAQANSDLKKKLAVYSEVISTYENRCALLEEEIRSLRLSDRHRSEQNQTDVSRRLIVPSFDLFSADYLFGGDTLRPPLLRHQVDGLVMLK